MMEGSLRELLGRNLRDPEVVKVIGFISELTFFGIHGIKIERKKMWFSDASRNRYQIAQTNSRNFSSVV